MRKILPGFLLFTVLNCFAQYTDPNFPKPESGYGSDGTHPVALETFNNVNFPGHTINIYYPGDVDGPVPTIFYCHAYGGNDPENIIGMLEFIAKKGYTVVFVPYQTLATVTVTERYENLIAGFRKAAQDYPEIIDTSTVGFLGHSFGGAACFGISHELFTTDGWGENGRFIYALAQWYAYNLTNEDLTSFPENTKVLFEIFNDDTTNDHRMAIDIFNHLQINPTEKDFILVPSSTVNGYNYLAQHNLPNTSSAFDALDYYAYYRFIDALADYAFTGNEDGKNVALGHGSSEQITMPGTMNSLVNYQNPEALYPQSNYEFPCSNETDNPRIEYCETTAGITNFGPNKIVVYPNPASDFLYIENTNQEMLKISLHNMLGTILYSDFSSKKNIDINIASLKTGIYFLTINKSTYKIIKE